MKWFWLRVTLVKVALAMALIGGTMPATAQFPDLTLSQVEGRVGDFIGFYATGLPANTAAIVTFDDAPVTTVPASLVTDSDGKITNAFFKVPPATAGSHQVQVNAGGVKTDKEAFTVNRTIFISPSKGPVGSKVTVTGTGFNKYVSIKVGTGATVVDVDTKAEVDAAAVETDPATVFSDSKGGWTGVITIEADKPAINAADDADVAWPMTFTIQAPAIVADPPVGTVGSTTTVNGEGYKPGSSVTVKFRTNGTTLSSVIVTADAVGAFSTAFTIPAAPKDLPGVDNDFEAKDNAGNVDTADFVVTESLSLSPSAGPAGTQVTATGTGFARLEVIKVQFDLDGDGVEAGEEVATTPATVATDSTGSFTLQFVVPESLLGKRDVKASTTNSAKTVKFEVTEKPVLLAKTDLKLGLDADQCAGCGPILLQVQDQGGQPVEMLIGGYVASLSYPGTLLNVLEARLKPPLDTGQGNIDNAQGVTSLAAFGADGGLPPLDPLAFLTLRLTGSVLQGGEATFTFNQVTDVEGNLLATLPAAFTFGFWRGDAKADGAVNIADALFIAQYLAGKRGLGTALNKVHPLNAASVKWDGNCDKISIADALLIAQYLVGLRGPDLAMAPPGSPPPRR